MQCSPAAGCLTGWGVDITYVGVSKNGTLEIPEMDVPKRDATSGEDFGLIVFQREGVDMFSLACWEEKPRDFALWLEIWQALSVQKGSQKKNRNYL